MKPRSIDYADVFARTYAAPAELIDVFGLAQWRDCPGRTDRIGKAGALILTSERVAHWSDGEESPDLLLPRASVDLDVGPRVFPRLRLLRVVVLDEPDTPAASFHVGKRFAAQLSNAWARPAHSISGLQTPTLVARGVWMPVVNHASGGPGTFAIEAGRPIFRTDGGVVHDYGWRNYASWSVAPSGQFFVGMSPAVGARLRFEPADPEAWRALLSENGVPERTGQ